MLGMFCQGGRERPMPAHVPFRLGRRFEREIEVTVVLAFRVECQRRLKSDPVWREAPVET